MNEAAQDAIYRLEISNFSSLLVLFYFQHLTNLCFAPAGDAFFFFFSGRLGKHITEVNIAPRVTCVLLSTRIQRRERRFDNCPPMQTDVTGYEKSSAGRPSYSAKLQQPLTCPQHRLPAFPHIPALQVQHTAVCRTTRWATKHRQNQVSSQFLPLRKSKQILPQSFAELRVPHLRVRKSPFDGTECAQRR